MSKNKSATIIPNITQRKRTKQMAEILPNAGQEKSASASKIESIIILLRRPKGATLEEMMEATGWQRHSVHGTLSGTIKKKRGLPLITEFGEHGRSYRIGTR